MIRAAADLLTESGLSAVDSRQVAAASATSNASVQHVFPGGKLELATVGLQKIEQDIAQWLRAVFHQREPITEKVALLFSDAARNMEASGFTKACPPVSLTLDMEHDSEKLRTVCRTVFMTWQDVIATGLDDIPEAERAGAAELILATLEGAMALSRAAAAKEPLLRAGKTLGGLFGEKFRAAPKRRAKPRRRKT